MILYLDLKALVCVWKILWNQLKNIRNSKQVQQSCRIQHQYVKINCISIS